MDMSISDYLETPDAASGLRAGDTDGGIALRDCLAANYGRLHRRLLRHLRCPDLASDCLHDAWLRLGDMTICATVQNHEAYVYRVACNVAMDRLRSNRPWQYTGDADTELESLVEPSPGPDLIAEVRSDIQAVERAIRCLPRRHQSILMALRIDGLTRHEVAASHGISLRRVDTVLRQALDYCAGQANQLVMAGVRSSRRALPHERMRA